MDRQRRRVAGVVLARARRLGEDTEGRAQVDGERPLDRAVRILSLGGADPVVVVLDDTAVADGVIEVPGADVVMVDEGGTPSSALGAGLAAPALAGCGAALILDLELIDPAIRTTAVRRLLAAYDEGADLAVATYAGERGQPVLVGRAHWTRWASEGAPSDGLGGYLVNRSADVVAVACDSARDTGGGAGRPAPTGSSGGGIFSRIAGDIGSAGAPLAAGLGELGALLGGAGARAANDEKAAEVVRRETFEAGQDPRTDVDLEAGVARIRTRPE